MLNSIAKFLLQNKLVTVPVLVLIVVWGIVTGPLTWKIGFFPRDPVPVDPIPVIGENQQILFTERIGRSPKDEEDQITCPHITSLLGLPVVISLLSRYACGFSSIYVAFIEDIEFYWSRPRVHGKLNSLPSGLQSTEVQSKLGGDATALGQKYMYTLEGKDEHGKPTTGQVKIFTCWAPLATIIYPIHPPRWKVWPRRLFLRGEKDLSQRLKKFWSKVALPTEQPVGIFTENKRF